MFTGLQALFAAAATALSGQLALSVLTAGLAGTLIACIAGWIHINHAWKIAAIGAVLLGVGQVAAAIQAASGG